MFGVEKVKAIELAPPKHKSKLAPTLTTSDELPLPPPKLVKPVRHLASDLKALTRVFNKDAPSEVLL